MKSVSISIEDSNKVEELFYNYNALLDLAKSFTEYNTVYQEVLQELKRSKLHLEKMKEEVMRKYITNTNPSFYSYNFIEQTIEYED